MAPFFCGLLIICCLRIELSFGRLLGRFLSSNCLIVSRFRFRQRVLGVVQRLAGGIDVAVELVAGDAVVFPRVAHSGLRGVHLQLGAVHAVFGLGQAAFRLVDPRLRRDGVGVQTVLIVFHRVFIRLAVDLNLMRRLAVAGVHRRLLLGDVHLQLLGVQLGQHVARLHPVAHLHVDRLHQIGQGGINLSVRLALHNAGQADGVLQIHLLQRLGGNHHGRPAVLIEQQVSSHNRDGHNAADHSDDFLFL